MQHELGRIDLVAWQARPLREGVRRRGFVTAALLGVAALALVVIALRFALGFPVSMPLLQLAFALLVVSGALLLMRATVAFLLRLQGR